jgi:hypothetical protein
MVYILQVVNDDREAEREPIPKTRSKDFKMKSINSAAARKLNDAMKNLNLSFVLKLAQAVNDGDAIMWAESGDLYLAEEELLIAFDGSSATVQNMMIALAESMASARRFELEMFECKVRLVGHHKAGDEYQPSNMSADSMIRDRV